MATNRTSRSDTARSSAFLESAAAASRRRTSAARRSVCWLPQSTLSRRKSSVEKFRNRMSPSATQRKSLDSRRNERGTSLIPEGAITRRERVAEEERRDPSGRQKDAERQPRLAVPATERDRGEAYGASRERGQEHRNEHARRAEKRADHREHLDVAQPHPLLSGNLLVKKREKIKTAPTDHGARKRRRRSLRLRKEGEKETGGEARQGDLVRKDLKLEIDCREGQTGRREENTREKFRPPRRQ